MQSVLSNMNETILVSEKSVDQDTINNLNTLKWGEALDSGFVVIPSALLRNQHKLGLNDGEIVVLLNLLMSWWGLSELPHIQTTTIANRMHVTRRTVQRHIENLEQKKFIRRIWAKRGVNERAGATYDLSGTVAILKEYGQLAHPARVANLQSEQAKELT